MPSPLETIAAESLDPAVKAQRDYVAKVEALQKQQETLLESLGTRTPGDTLLSMAQGFLAPTRTGSFGESFGTGIAQLRGSQAAEEKRAEELAKMRLALVQQQAGTAKELAGMAMADRLFGGAGASTTGAAPARVPPTAATPTKVSTGAAAGAPAPTPAGGEAFRNVTGSDIARLSMFNPELAKAMENAIKVDQDRFVIAQNGVVFDKRSGQYIQMAIPGQKQEEFTIGSKTYKMTPSQYQQFLEANQAGGGQEFLNKLLSGPTATAPGGAAPSTELPKSVSEMEVEKAGATTTAQERAKSSATRRDAILSTAEAAPRMESLSQANIELIKANPDAVGVLAAPGIGNAVLTLLQKVRGSAGVQGTGAGVEIDTSSVEEALKKLGPSRLPNETDAAYQARKQRIIDASSMIVRNLAEMELVAAKSFLKGQGAVSNMERNITKSLGGNISDSRNALMAKSELTALTAQYDQMIRDRMLAWEEGAGKGKGTEHFLADKKEYKALVDEYNKKVGEINSRYFGAKPTAPATSTGTSDLRERLKQQLGIQ